MPPLNIDTGNTAFMLLCSSLVMLMTPGLAFFTVDSSGPECSGDYDAILRLHGVDDGVVVSVWFLGLLQRRSKSGTVSSACWGKLPLNAFFVGITLDTPSLINPSIPMIVFCAYQMMFAIITPALITGAFANRVTFKAYMLFLTGWLTLVYFPVRAHGFGAAGVMPSWGVLDFAGGIVVPPTSPASLRWRTVLYVGRRKIADSGPHSIPLVALDRRPSLVWMVRVQRRLGVPRGFGDGGRFSEYRSGRQLCAMRGSAWTGCDDKETKSFSGC